MKVLDTIQDFFASWAYAYIGNHHFFSLNHVIVRPTKIVNPIPTRLCHGDKSYPCLVGIGLRTSVKPVH